MPSDSPSASPDHIARADAIYRLRRRRAIALPALADLLGEPVWDLLLDLYVAQARGRRVSVSDACLAADVPLSTALRYIARLEARGLVTRAGDPRDARRFFVTMSDGLREGMDRLLDRGAA